MLVASCVTEHVADRLARRIGVEPSPPPDTREALVITTGGEVPSPSAVRAAFLRATDAVRACGHCEGGSVVVVVTFDRVGRPGTIHVEGVAPGPLADCVTTAVRGVTLPPFARPTFSASYLYRMAGDDTNDAPGVTPAHSVAPTAAEEDILSVDTIGHCAGGGPVALRVTVESDGRVSEAHALTDPGGRCARAAERAVCSGAIRFSAARDRRGNPMRSTIDYRIRFERDDPED